MARPRPAAILACGPVRVLVGFPPGDCAGRGDGSRQIGTDAINPILVVEGRDSDGDPYFRGVLTAAGVGDVTISEGHHRANVENDVNRLRSAVTI
jgi:hypothetical protein